MRRQGGYLFVVTALILGLGLGLLVSLVISPVTYQNVSPAMLKPADKDLYRAMIALSFNARGDLGRAQARLGLLEEADPRSALAAQAQQYIAQGKPADESRSLALLASALGSTGSGSTGSGSTGSPGGTPVAELTESLSTPEAPEHQLTLPPSTPSIDLTPTLDIPVERPTLPVEAPTARPSPTPGEPYMVMDRKGICDVEYSQVLQVYVIDKDGKSVPGAEVVVTWEDGEDHFFTGMKPSIDPGYADFKMQPDVLYNVRMASGGQTATRVATGNCITTQGVAYKGGDKIIFGAP